MLPPGTLQLLKLRLLDAIATSPEARLVTLEVQTRRGHVEWADIAPARDRIVMPPRIR